MDEDEERYLSHHPVWSQLFLMELIEEEGLRAREQFETVVNALFRVAKRTGQQSLLDRLVSSVFTLCEEYPPLEPLFVTSDDSGIDTSACSLVVRANCALHRHRMYRTLGEIDTANEELKIFKKRADRGDKGIVNRVFSRIPGSIFTRETQADAVYYNHLGLVARNQGDYESAREYHQQSLEITRELGDRAGEANQLGNLGNVATEQEELETAQERFEQASERFVELGAVRRALTALSNLASVAAERDDTETALDASESALTLINESEIDGLDERAREFTIRVARLQETPESTIELYYHGLGHILEIEGGAAMTLLKETWERRERFDPDDEVYRHILAAGVGFAAHLELFDSEEVETDSEDVLSEIKPHADDLSTPSRALFAHLNGTDPEGTPADLREMAQGSPDEESIGAQLESLELRAYAELLQLLIEEWIADQLRRDQEPAFLGNGIRIS